ncbi:MAG: type II secretion system protein [bacterium]|nr:type II secretion system protein [bacterium]
MKTFKVNLQENKRGFTIIEVVLVLAIAGLIFLMVFIALPTLQRNQRDTQRKSQISSIAAQLENSRENDRGREVSDYATNQQLEIFIENYLKPHQDEYKDPATGKFYTFLKCGGKVNCGTGNGLENLEIGEIYYNSGASCDGETFIDQPRNASHFVLITKMEGGGRYCFSNKPGKKN